MLWTDGRFFIQAEEQMDDSFTLMRMGVEGVPTVSEFLAEKLPENGCLGFDGRLISVKQRDAFREKLADKNIRFAWEEDLVDMVWPERPAIEPQPAWLLG